MTLPKSEIPAIILYASQKYSKVIFKLTSKASGDMDKKSSDTENRRDFLKKAVYAAPVILTLNAVPAFANNGSGRGSGGGGGGKCPELHGDC
jgi:hypothetical protein